MTNGYCLPDGIAWPLPFIWLLQRPYIFLLASRWLKKKVPTDRFNWQTGMVKCYNSIFLDLNFIKDRLNGILFSRCKYLQLKRKIISPKGVNYYPLNIYSVDSVFFHQPLCRGWCFSTNQRLPTYMEKLNSCFCCSY